MKKKLLSLILTIVLVISLSACGAGEQKDNQNSSELTSQKGELNEDSQVGIGETTGNKNDADKTEDDKDNSGNTQKGDTQGESGEDKENSESGQNKDEVNKNDSNKNDSNKNDSNKNDSNKNDSNKNDSNKNDSNKNDSNKNDSNKNDSNKNDSNSNQNNSNQTGSGSGGNNQTDAGNTSGGSNTGAPVSTVYVDSFTETENALADAVIAKIVHSNMGEFERVKAIHDYLLMNVDYDYQNYLNNTIPMDSHKAIGALNNKIAVCDGYSYAFQLLCQKIGISCEFVTGVAAESGTNNQIAHAWNQVQIEGKWYNIDVTWDDPAMVNGTMLGFNDHSGNSYEYFCVPDSIINKDHIADSTKYTCTSPCLFERALKAGVPWDSAKYAASESELVALLKAEAQKNNANPSFYIKAATIAGDTITFFSKCLSEAGIDISKGYSCTYYTYFEGTTDPGVYYKFIINLP